jgi:hypothetical protein
MTVTAAQIARLRRMVAELPEPLAVYYSDALLTTIIESYPTLDENGEAPRIPAEDSNHTVTYTTDMDTLDLVENEDWIPTYDLNAAAAQIWEEKAATPAADFDFSADGGNYKRSQVYEQAMKQARYYNSRRKASTIKLKPFPHQRNTSSLS